MISYWNLFVCVEDMILQIKKAVRFHETRITVITILDGTLVQLTDGFHRREISLSTDKSDSSDGFADPFLKHASLMQCAIVSTSTYRNSKISETNLGL